MLAPRASTRRLGFACACILVFCAPLRAEPGAAEKPVDLGDYLSAIAVRYDRYFTVELASPEHTDTEGEFLGNAIRGTGHDGSLEDCIALIRHELPQYEVVQDPDNTAVYHIMDKELKKMDNYPIDRTAAVRYTGGLQSFPHHLTPDAGAIRGPLAQWIGLAYDNATQVTIDTAGKKVRVRGLLTDYMPLSQYSRFLWCAQTRPEQGGLVTEVHYGGGTLNDNDRVEFCRKVLELQQLRTKRESSKKRPRFSHRDAVDQRRDPIRLRRNRLPEQSGP